MAASVCGVRILIVGGGVLGTLHAWQAVERGHDVVQLEREPEARGASVRNFGLVWVGGRATGAELGTALRARALWERIGERVPGLGFRANGSLTVVRTAAELAVAQEVAAGAEAADRGYKLLDAAEAQDLNPALRGDFLGALWCDRDAAVEPRVAQPALRAELARSGRYTWRPGREVRHLTATGVVDDRGSGTTVTSSSSAPARGPAGSCANSPASRRCARCGCRWRRPSRSARS